MIYFHSQVVDGQRKIISLLQDQIQNVRHHLVFKYRSWWVFSVQVYHSARMLYTEMYLYFFFFPACLQEGEDKKFLINRLQSVHKQKQDAGKRLKSQVGHLYNHQHF